MANATTGESIFGWAPDGWPSVGKGSFTWRRSIKVSSEGFLDKEDSHWIVLCLHGRGNLHPWVDPYMDLHITLTETGSMKLNVQDG